MINIWFFCYSLPSGIQIGRSNTQQVAEKRKIDIEKFLVSLFKMADEIAHSDIVYTFFHSLLRDEEEEIDINKKKMKGFMFVIKIFFITNQELVLKKKSIFIR